MQVRVTTTVDGILRITALKSPPFNREIIRETNIIIKPASVLNPMLCRENDPAVSQFWSMFIGIPLNRSVKYLTTKKLRGDKPLNFTGCVGLPSTHPVTYRCAYTTLLKPITVQALRTCCLHGLPMILSKHQGISYCIEHTLSFKGF